MAPAYAQLPLNRITVGDAVNGGQMTDLTAGVNWYLNPYTKLVFNYIHAYTDDPKLGWNDTDAIGMRAQIDF